MRRGPLTTALVPALTAGGVPSLGPAATAAPARAVPALPQDVDGDGYAEAVVGVPGGGEGGCLTAVPDAVWAVTRPLLSFQPGLPRPPGEAHRPGRHLGR
ncbi:hypothetical protein [Streptomyces sp. SID8014]|uniref:hypothetical protein n=1 Tax=Streptomyces sp. SID8014 TaxID=2706097 RepID=UPI001EF1A8C5|nr:hypothetical protein [Streptomyces sp. SID8014]